MRQRLALDGQEEINKCKDKMGQMSKGKGHKGWKREGE